MGGGASWCAPVDAERRLGTKDLLPAVAAGTQSEREQAIREYFPMHTVNMDIFLALARMESFEQLQARHATRPASPNAIIHFLSHEWLGLSHPDPNAAQLRRIQEVFRTIVDGGVSELFHPADWSGFCERVSAGSKGAWREAEGRCMREIVGGPLTADLFCDHILHGEVWVDFGSIPQVLSDPHCLMLRSMQLEAIRSIPAYLNRCHYFWVVAPTARHADKGTWCNFATWRSRGWCRLEEWGNYLSETPCAPLIVTNAKKLSTIGFLEVMIASQAKPEMAPCAGYFTCCQVGQGLATHAASCDKTFIRPVLETLYEAKRKQLRANPSGKFFHANLVSMVEPMLFGGAPTPRAPTGRPKEEESLAEFLHRFAFDSPLEVLPLSFTAWHYAAMLGHVPMLKQLQHHPGAVQLLADDKAVENLMIVCVSQGRVDTVKFLLQEGLMEPEALFARVATQAIAPVDRASKLDFPEMVTFLIDRRASVDVRRADGSTPLHSAATAGRVKSSQVLLARRADVNATDHRGRTPVHLAADPLTFYGDAEGKLEVLKVLLQHRADLRVRDAEGHTPLDAARAAFFFEAEALIGASGGEGAESDDLGVEMN